MPSGRVASPWFFGPSSYFQALGVVRLLVWQLTSGIGIQTRKRHGSRDTLKDCAMTASLYCKYYMYMNVKNTKYTRRKVNMGAKTWGGGGGGIMKVINSYEGESLL